MNDGYKKYRPFVGVDLADRKWPSKRIEKAPVWCSVDLRDGNQALVNPMNLEEKIEMFEFLCKLGIKEIEVGFPSASKTEFDVVRTLIEEDLIPDDVWIQVLVQSREHLIDKTFEAVKGAKNVILHFYNSTSAQQRKVVFHKDKQGIIDIAVAGAKHIRKLADEYAAECGMNIRFEYSPESFTGTEPDFAVEICSRVMEILEPDGKNPIILNLPASVELSTPNAYADMIEYFCNKLPYRDNAIISLHPHNDRGTAVAAAELGLLAGADRIEGTLFGSGERTGNVDLITLALNMYTQAVDPKLDLHNINEIKEMYERTTKMDVAKRHPYAGELVFTAFSGSHQDAINKGELYMNTSNSPYWDVPYLPICPADIGRDYEPIIRINSQSGKGGAAFVMSNVFGYNLPKAMLPEFGAAVKAQCDASGGEITGEDVYAIFKREYLDVTTPFKLLTNKIIEEYDPNFTSPVICFVGKISKNGAEAVEITGRGNGPVDAFFNALKSLGIEGYNFVDYSQHAVSVGSDAKGICYVQLKDSNGKPSFGVGMSHNTNYASIRAVLCAINRSLQ